jgi:hypothetical protein
MSTNRMDVFDLRRAVVDEYRGFATSFTRVFAPDIKTQVNRIYDEGRFWPEPLVQLNPKYQPGGSVAELCAQGALHPRCAEIFNISLYRHQAEAVSLANAGRSYVVTTGTGSGKSLCFFVPIVERHLGREGADPTPRTRAIVIYPMNAWPTASARSWRSSSAATTPSAPSPSRATPARSPPRSASGSPPTRPTSCSPTS